MPLPPVTRILAFAEAASSPVKYAMFQSCGHAFINLIGFGASLPPSLTSPLKIGSFGGTILTFFYFALLLRKSSTTRPGCDVSLVSYVVGLVKEILYSAVGAYLGVMGCGHRDEMRWFMLAGALGPIVATVVIVGVLGLVAGIVWCVERFRDWRAGY
jgi:hypothetical protein